ncbi:MAG: hypothetical protein PF638_14870 [Candidatus Delongbacteria bacterium]|jgi:hypothetical protein|nr:hypothetical protein [Candidatus Delongbacteria bacterium]
MKIEINYKKTSFNILISILFFTFIFTLLLYLFEANIMEYLISVNFESLFNSEIYGVSINIFTFLITILFSLIGIYISKISNFNLSTSDYIKHLGYYFAIFAYVIGLLIVHIFFDFYCLKFPHNLFSIVALISSILILFPLAIRTIYSLSSENYFELISGNLENYIRITSKLGNARSISKKYYDGLILKMNILFENLISTIVNKNDFVITKKILDEIPRLVERHLIETNKILFKDEQELLSSLNDNYEFVFRSIKDSYNEKLYEYLVKSVGHTSMVFHNDTKKGEINRNYDKHLLYLLVDFYYKTFQLKRTSVCHDIINVFSQHIYQHDKNHNISQNSYITFLDKIEEFLFKNLEGPHGFWASMNYRNVVGIKRKRFIILLKQFAELDNVFSDMNHIRRFFNDFAKGFIEVKNKSKNLMVIYPALFGVDSFIWDIANLNLGKLEKDEQKINVNHYIAELLHFYRNIILIDFDKNEPSVYDFYSEFTFLVLFSIDLLNVDKDKHVQNVFELVLENTEKCYTLKTDKKIYLSHHLKDHFLDSFALYLFSIKDEKEQNVQVIANIIEKVLETYEKFESKYKTDFYPVMKLIGCWINYIIEIDNKLIEKFNLSIADFPDVKEDIFRRSTGTDFQMLNYHTSGLSYKGFNLSPSSLWNHPFQIVMSNYFNQDMSIYEKYHEKLEALKK